MKRHSECEQEKQSWLMNKSFLPLFSFVGFGTSTFWEREPQNTLENSFDNRQPLLAIFQLAVVRLPPNNITQVGSIIGW